MLNLKQLRKQIAGTKNHYETLGVSPRICADGLKMKHRALVSLLHPDRCEAKDAHDLCARVNVAYDVLSNPNKRRVYDLINKIVVTNPCILCKGSGTKAKQRRLVRTVDLCEHCNGGGLEP